MEVEKGRWDGKIALYCGIPVYCESHNYRVNGRISNWVQFRNLIPGPNGTGPAQLGSIVSGDYDNGAFTVAHQWEIKQTKEFVFKTG